MKYVILESILGIFFFPALLFASPTYTVAPLVFDLSVEPRDIITKDITLTNTGDAPVTVYPSVNNISLDEEGRLDEFIPPSMSDKTSSLSSWIEIKRSGINLPVGESVKIPVTFRINPEPKPGVYHAFIGFGNGRTTDDAEAMVKNGSAPGIVVTITIEEKRIELLRISKFIVNRFVTSDKNSAITYTLNNSGDQPLIPEGDIIFYNNKGVEVLSLPVNTDKTVLQPETEQEFKTSLPMNGLFGKYKAFISVEYGSANRSSIQDTAFFYVFPLKILLIIFGVFLFIVAVLAFFVHRNYLAETYEEDDADRLHLHVREGTSPDVHHDLHLTKKDS